MKRRKYSQEFREEAIKMVIEEGHSAAEVERNLGMGAGLLGRWIRQLYARIAFLEKADPATKCGSRVL